MVSKVISTEDNLQLYSDFSLARIEAVTPEQAAGFRRRRKSAGVRSMSG